MSAFEWGDVARYLLLLLWLFGATMMVGAGLTWGMLVASTLWRKLP